jgi:hypothetical protein
MSYIDYNEWRNSVLPILEKYYQKADLMLDDSQCRALDTYNQQTQSYGIAHEDPGDVQVPQVTHTPFYSKSIPSLMESETNVTWDNYNSSDPMWNEPLEITMTPEERAYVETLGTWVDILVAGVAPLHQNPDLCAEAAPNLDDMIKNLYRSAAENLSEDLDVYVTKNTNPECDINWDYRVAETEIGFGPLVPAAKAPDPEPQYDHHVHIPLPGSGSYRVTWDGEVHTGKKSFP